MKRYLVVVLFLGLVFTLHAQIEVKGIKLGEKYYGEKETITSLGGISGTIEVLQMEDKTVYGFEFENCKFDPQGASWKSCNTVDPEDLNLFIEGFNENFRIKFRSETKEKKDTDIYGRVTVICNTQSGFAVENGIRYTYSLRISNELNILYRNHFVLKIYNLKLKELKEEHDKNDKKQEILNDF